jgi:hypothetical protein
VANSAEAARKVADAAVAYFEFFGIRKHVRLGGVLADAVREYRKLKEASNEQVKRTEANAD